MGQAQERGRGLDLPSASRFSRPGKPTDNAHVESFNGTFRKECLDAHWFTTLTEAEHLVEAWRREYNESRPHRALGERTPRRSRKLTLKVVQKTQTTQAM